jgi:hypothetical protein
MAAIAAHLLLQQTLPLLVLLHLTISAACRQRKTR